MTYEYVLKTVNEVKGDHHLHKFQSKQAGIQIKSHRADPFLFGKKKQSKKSPKSASHLPKEKKNSNPTEPSTHTLSPLKKLPTKKPQQTSIFCIYHEV